MNHLSRWILALALGALLGASRASASVNETGVDNYIRHITVGYQAYGLNQGYATYEQTFDIWPSGWIEITDGYFNGEFNGVWDNWTIYANVVGVWEEYIGGNNGGGGGGGEGVSDPFAVVDENGVGSLEPFEIEPYQGSNSIPAAAEFLGLAVGIFVEPVDWAMTLVEIWRNPADPWSYLGMIPGVPSGAGKLIKKALNVAHDANATFRAMSNGAVLTFERMQHIISGHQFNSPKIMHKSHFSQGTTDKQIADYINDTINHNGGVPNYQQPNGNFVFYKEYDYSLGTGAVTNPGQYGPDGARWLKVIVDENGHVLTAYPQNLPDGLP